MIGGGYFQFWEYPFFCTAPCIGNMLHEAGWHHEAIVPDRIREISGQGFFCVRVDETAIYHWSMARQAEKNSPRLVFWERKG